MYSEELPEDYVVCVCLACISLIEKGADDFEKIEKGLREKNERGFCHETSGRTFVD